MGDNLKAALRCLQSDGVPHRDILKPCTADGEVGATREIRSALQNYCSSMDADTEATAAAEALCAELEKQIQDARSVCAELVQDRGRQLVELVSKQTSNMKRSNEDLAIRLQELQETAEHDEQLDADIGANLEADKSSPHVQSQSTKLLFKMPVR